MHPRLPSNLTLRNRSVKYRKFEYMRWVSLAPHPALKAFFPPAEKSRQDKILVLTANVNNQQDQRSICPLVVAITFARISTDALLLYTPNF